MMIETDKNGYFSNKEVKTSPFYPRQIRLSADAHSQKTNKNRRAETRTVKFLSLEGRG